MGPIKSSQMSQLSTSDKTTNNHVTTTATMTDFVQLHPQDEYNQRLESHVHPPDWVNPSPGGPYHLVVVGAGTAGLVTAAAAAGLGARVALLERELMGGDCLNVGCVPSKALISSARVAATVREAASFGVQVPGEAVVDFGKVMERMRRLRASISPVDSAARFRELGVDVFLGQARFEGPGKIDVNGIQLRYKKAVIATGARASVPSIPGLDQVEYLTNETVFSLTELPRRLGVIGAGPIGCELSQAFARFGSEVSLVAAGGDILPREDRVAAAIVKKAMLAGGVKVLGGGKNLQLAPEGRAIRMQVATGDETCDFRVDKLLIATGRSPNVDELGLENVGVEFDKRQGVKVNDKLQTTNSRIFAAGDVCSKYKFTHAADFMARTVIRNALFWGRAKVSALTIPWCTYTSPEIAHVGLGEKEAAGQGIKIDTFCQELAQVDRAILEGEDQGFVKIHVKKGTDKILGATVVATNAGDMIAEITLAMTYGLGLAKIADTIHPYPTQAEAVRKVGDQYKKSLLTPRIRVILDTLRWFAGMH